MMAELEVDQTNLPRVQEGEQTPPFVREQNHQVMGSVPP